MIDEVGEQSLAFQFIFAEEKLERKIGPFHIRNDRQAKFKPKTFFNLISLLSMADLPGSLQYVKNCLAFLPHADVALLVVHSEIGVEEFTKTLFYLAKHLQVPHIIPVINQPQDDPETLELILMELEELDGLQEVCVVDNLGEKDEGLLDLLKTIESTAEKGPAREKGQFKMALEQVYTL